VEVCLIAHPQVHLFIFFKHPQHILKIGFVVDNHPNYEIAQSEFCKVEIEDLDGESSPMCHVFRGVRHDVWPFGVDFLTAPVEQLRCFQGFELFSHYHL
jgi:hypothetical protein